MTDKAQNWHNGCSADEARNSFVIPKIIELISPLGAGKVGFFGCATGYIPSEVSAQLKSRSEFHLVDIDEDYLNFAEGLKYGDCGVFFHNHDITLEPLKEDFLDVVVISNTLLEIQLTEESVRQIVANLKLGGELVIFTPDVLSDVVSEDKTNSADILEQYSTGSVHIQNKIDRFTKLPYPFLAHRNLHLISSFLRSGLVLSEIEFGAKGNQYIMLKFRR